MGRSIKLSDELLADASSYGKALQRSTPRQIEYWARLGKLAEENSDLPLTFIKDTLVAIEESEADEVSEFRFG